MPRETETTIQETITHKPITQEPIMELWRILALALIVAAGMLFVHVVVPAEAEASSEPASAVTAIR